MRVLQDSSESPALLRLRYGNKLARTSLRRYPRRDLENSTDECDPYSTRSSSKPAGWQVTGHESLQPLNHYDCALPKTKGPEKLVPVVVALKPLP
jgi:hypothetical protein